MALTYHCGYIDEIKLYFRFNPKIIQLEIIDSINSLKISMNNTVDVIINCGVSIHTVPCPHSIRIFVCFMLIC